MTRQILVQGAGGGLGHALVARLLAETDTRIYAATRDPDRNRALTALAEGEHGARLTPLALNVTDEDSLTAARRQIGTHTQRLDTLITCAGLLHDEANGLWPEKQLADVEPASLARSFAMNATGPLLMIKHFHDLLIHGERAVIASLSARVGSIGDNRLGGWYAYRAAKAAQNQFTRTAAIELRRKSRALICVGLHPGTVDTGLSAPFSARVPDKRLQTADQAAAHLLSVIERLTPDDSGRVFDWAGQRIAP